MCVHKGLCLDGWMGLYGWMVGWFGYIAICNTLSPSIPHFKSYIYAPALVLPQLCGVVKAAAIYIHLSLTTITNTRISS